MSPQEASASFDPYHRWLGIPPLEQPPNHYRLLGLPLFEDDVEVIRDAADRHRSHVRRYLNGEHHLQAEALRQEIVNAKRCLLQPVEKQRYDDGLRAGEPLEVGDVFAMYEQSANLSGPTGDFDPYYRWLGIPSYEQPVDHYRLLGIARFEGDSDVIRDAAERQMCHIRGYASGEHAAHSNQLLNDLGRARACLLDAARRGDYDRKLRAEASSVFEPLPLDSPDPLTLPLQATSPAVPVAEPTVEGPADRDDSTPSINVRPGHRKTRPVGRHRRAMPATVAPPKELPDSRLATPAVVSPRPHAAAGRLVQTMRRQRDQLLLVASLLTLSVLIVAVLIWLYWRSASDPPRPAQPASYRSSTAGGPTSLDDRSFDYQPPRERLLAATSEFRGQTWRYTFTEPPQSWTSPRFNDSDWKTGHGGFGDATTPGAIVRTDWRTGDIWLRRTFQLPASEPVRPGLRVHHDEGVEVYVNGQLVFEQEGYLQEYVELDLPGIARASFRAGQNTLAVHCRQTRGGQYIDVGLLDRG